MVEWAAYLYAKMRIHGVRWGDVAERLGLHRNYVSHIINGKEHPKNAQQRFEAAVDEIIAEKATKSADNV